MCTVGVCNVCQNTALLVVLVLCVMTVTVSGTMCTVGVCNVCQCTALLVVLVLCVMTVTVSATYYCFF